ncbi:MAG TPA: hypothetical protein ENN81_07090 [Phycisphaerales bacterium]|nr:hypothetical protein [Phycisphaerales bacterium]
MHCRFGIGETAGWIRREFLTGTAIAVILALLMPLGIQKLRNRLTGNGTRKICKDLSILSIG